MAEIFNRKLSDHAVGFWVEELFPYYGSHLEAALREAMRDKFMPAIDAVIARTKALEKRSESEAFMERLREAEAKLQPQPKTLAEEKSANEMADNFFAEMRKKLGYEELVTPGDLQAMAMQRNPVKDGEEPF